MSVWPYPRWIAHRGAGVLAPENTLAAFRLGARHGFRMFECDVKLSADGIPFLLHDATLERTTDARGLAGDRTWRELSSLDAGAWHSAAFAGEPLCTLEALSAWCRQASCLLNIEIKPTPGLEHKTGEAVARAAAEQWRAAAAPPLLTSFQEQALRGAARTAPELPRGLLLHTWDDRAFPLARELGLSALVCQHALWTPERLDAAAAAGLKRLSYTVNEPEIADRLWAWGHDGLITDRVDLFDPQH